MRIENKYKVDFLDSNLKSYNLISGGIQTLDFDYKKVFNDELKLFATRLKDKEFIFDERPIIKYELGKEIEEVEK